MGAQGKSGCAIWYFQLLCSRSCPFEIIIEPVNTPPALFWLMLKSFYGFNPGQVTIGILDKINIQLFSESCYIFKSLFILLFWKNVGVAVKESNFIAFIE